MSIEFLKAHIKFDRTDERCVFFVNSTEDSLLGTEQGSAGQTRWISLGGTRNDLREG